MSFDWIEHELKCNISDFNGISKEEMESIEQDE